MAKFKIGDRVKCVRMVSGNEHVVGKIGTIIENDGITFGVEFDDYVYGHGCVSNGILHKFGYCWWCKELDLVKACDESDLANVHNGKIVITTDGKTTTAKLYDGKKFVKAAKAICSPEDEFDIVIGTMIAFSRLFDADIRFVDAFDWDAFKNDEVFVQVTADNFDEFIEEAEKHGCFFKDHDKFNPFKDEKLMRIIRFTPKFFVEPGDFFAPEGAVLIGCHENILGFTAHAGDNKLVYTW